MRFSADELLFILLFLGGIGLLQAGYWAERRVLRRLRTLAPEAWREYTYFFGERLRTGALKRRMAMGGLRDENLAALLRRRGRINACALGAFLAAMLLMALFRIGW